MAWRITRQTSIVRFVTSTFKLLLDIPQNQKFITDVIYRLTDIYSGNIKELPYYCIVFTDNNDDLSNVSLSNSAIVHMGFPLK